MYSSEERRRKRREEYLRRTGRSLTVRGEEMERALRRVRSFHARGMSYAHMARLTGLPVRTIANLARERRSSMRRGIRDALLRMPFQEPLPTTWVSPVGTRRRLGAMWLEGYPLPWITERLGFSQRTYLQALIRGSKGVSGVEYRTHRAVAELYEKLEGRRPEEFGIDARASKFSVSFARKRGVVPRSCWDPETIDDPDAIPEWTGYCGTGLGVVIHRRDQIPVCRPCAEAYDYRDPYPGFSGEKFREIRESRKISRTKLGHLVGVDGSTFKYWETGRSRPQRQGKLDLALSHLDADFSDVCDIGEGHGS